MDQLPEKTPTKERVIEFAAPSRLATYSPILITIPVAAALVLLIPLVALPVELNPISYEYPEEFESQASSEQYLDILRTQLGLYFASLVSSDVSIRAATAGERFVVFIIGAGGYLLAICIAGKGLRTTLNRRRQRQEGGSK